jgi:hypothetical protein
MAEAKPTRTAGAPAPRSGSGAAARVVLGISECQIETPQHVDTSYARLTGVADKVVSHTQTVAQTPCGVTGETLILDTSYATVSPLLAVLGP